MRRLLGCSSEFFSVYDANCFWDDADLNGFAFVDVAVDLEFAVFARFYADVFPGEGLEFRAACK